MQYKYFATIENSRVAATSDSTPPREPLENEISLDSAELMILRTFNGNLDLARKTINDLEARIALFAMSHPK